MTKPITIALAGNPNCGKTVLFNALTGSRQRVGNWPGVTVDRKIGAFNVDQQVVTVVDLPGIYSTHMADEVAVDAKIACDYLLNCQPDLLVNIIDASNLERNLYLTAQLREMGVPMVVAVNMMDMLQQQGLVIDLKKLSQLLGCPVVGLVASQGKGIEALKSQIVTYHQQQTSVNPMQLQLPESVQRAVADLSRAVLPSHHNPVVAKWLAARLLEDDQWARAQVSAACQEQADQMIQVLSESLAEDTDIVMADARYSCVNSLVDQVVRLIKTPRQTLTQCLDRIVLNRYAGIPIFLLMMYLMFLFAINIGGAFQDLFDIGSTTIFVDGVAYLCQLVHVPTWLTAILANGVGKGINTVVTFIPVLAGMFLFLSFLEDCGYMARAAFVMDRFMRAIGLPGKSFVPMIVGFGCNVPAVMGARTLANRRDRVLTVMMMPFMSCGARLAIFTVFASAFFAQGGQNVIFLLYLVGILVAVLTGLVLRKTLLPGKPAPLVMELPPYHLPRPLTMCRHAWYRLQHFLKRASRVIVPVCVIIGALNALTLSGHFVSNSQGGKQTLLSAVGRAVTPVLMPMGVDSNNWPATVGLVTGVLAKEVVVGTLNTLYSDEAGVADQAVDFDFWAGIKSALLSVPTNLANLGSAFANPIAADEAPHEMNHTAYGLMYHSFDGKIGAFAYLLFVLLYFPCVTTMAVMRREVGRAWAYFSMLWSAGVAYSLAVLAYQLLTLSRHPVSSSLWSVGVLIVMALAIYSMRRYAQGDQLAHVSDRRHHQQPTVL